MRLVKLHSACVQCTVEIATDTRTDRKAGFIIVFDRECHPVIAEKRKIWALLAPALPWRV